MTAEEYSPFLIGALGEFYAAKGFEFIKTPRMLKIVDAWIKSKDLAMTFDFVPNKDEPDGGMVVLKRVS